MLAFAVASRSERGQRQSNEDLLAVGGTDALLHLVLADGAGGHRGGADASRLAVATLDAALRASAVPSPEALTQAVRAAHARVQQEQPASHGSDRMHATVVALWLDAVTHSALWSHVGDSRLYRWRDGALEQLTCDDSIVQRMLDAGLLNESQAKVHPHRHQLIAALGIEDEVEPATTTEPMQLLAGDAFLLCSDGWWEPLDATAMAETLRQSATPTAWLSLMHERIEAMAVARQDNYSAIAVWVAQPGVG